MSGVGVEWPYHEDVTHIFLAISRVPKRRGLELQKLPVKPGGCGKKF